MKNRAMKFQKELRAIANCGAYREVKTVIAAEESSSARFGTGIVQVGKDDDWLTRQRTTDTTEVAE